MKSPAVPNVTPAWVCYRRALGFSILLKKLQQIRGSERGYMYNSPAYMFIYADGSCMPRFDVINKISSDISLINSCRIAGSHETHLQLCNLLHKEKDAQCSICHSRFRQKRDGPKHLSKRNPTTVKVCRQQPPMCFYYLTKAVYCLLLEKAMPLIKVKYELLYERMLHVGLLSLFKAPLPFSKRHQKSDARHPLLKLVESSKNSWSEKSPSREQSV